MRGWGAEVMTRRRRTSRIRRRRRQKRMETRGEVHKLLELEREASEVPS